MDGASKADSMGSRNKTNNLDRKEGSMSVADIESIEGRVHRPNRRASDERIDAIVQELQAQRQMIEEIRVDVAGVVEAWHAIEGGLKVLGALSKVAKFFTAVALGVTALSAAWYAMTHWGQAPGGK